MNRTLVNIIFISIPALVEVKGYSIPEKNDADVLIIFTLEPSRPAYRIMYDRIRQKL